MVNSALDDKASDVGKSIDVVEDELQDGPCDFKSLDFNSARFFEECDYSPKIGAVFFGTDHGLWDRQTCECLIC